MFGNVVTAKVCGLITCMRLVVGSPPTEVGVGRTKPGPTKSSTSGHASTTAMVEDSTVMTQAMDIAHLVKQKRAGADANTSQCLISCDFQKFIFEYLGSNFAVLSTISI